MQFAEYLAQQYPAFFAKGGMVRPRKKKPKAPVYAQGGVTLTPVEGLDAVLQALLQALTSVQTMGQTLGFVPQNVMRAALEPFGGAGQGFFLPLQSRLALAQMAANPRDLFTLLFAARGEETPRELQPMALTEALTSRIAEPVGGGTQPQPSPQPPPQPPPQPRTYTIQPGDTLSGIAARHGLSWERLWEVNRNRLRSGSPHLIYPGEVIEIPNAQEGKVVPGPTFLLVGEGKGGLQRGSAEVVLAPPGTVVAPLGKRDPTLANAVMLIARQIKKSLRRAQSGASVLPRDVMQAIERIPGLRDVLQGRPVSGLEPFRPLPGRETPSYRPPTQANIFDIQRLTPTQLGLFQSYLSALGIPPEDYLAVARQAAEATLGRPLARGIPAAVVPGGDRLRV